MLPFYIVKITMSKLQWLKKNNLKPKCTNCLYVQTVHVVNIPVGTTMVVIKYKQEGPKGPKSLTWGKCQSSKSSHLQRTTNVVQQILVEDLVLMLDIKYESPGPCSFRREDFWKLHFENLFFDPVTNNNSC